MGNLAATVTCKGRRMGKQNCYHSQNPSTVPHLSTSSLKRYTSDHPHYTDEERNTRGKRVNLYLPILVSWHIFVFGWLPKTLLGHSYPHAFYCLCGYFSSSNFYSLPELLLDVNSSSGSIFHVMDIFSYFLCFNIQELTAYFQGSLYMFKRHYTFLNLFSFVSYINSVASGLFFYIWSVWAISYRLLISHKCLVIFVVCSHYKCINISVHTEITLLL